MAVIKRGVASFKKFSKIIGCNKKEGGVTLWEFDISLGNEN